MSYETQITVAFNDIDAAGIVYFANVFDYCHQAYEHLLEAISLPLSHILNEEQWAMPLVHAEADYMAPMRHGERITIQIRLRKVGRSAMHFGYELYGPNGNLRARVLLVHAAVETTGFRPQAVNTEFVDALSKIGLNPEE